MLRLPRGRGGTLNYSKSCTFLEDCHFALECSFMHISKIFSHVLHMLLHISSYFPRISSNFFIFPAYISRGGGSPEPELFQVPRLYWLLALRFALEGSFMYVFNIFSHASRIFLHISHKSHINRGGARDPEIFQVPRSMYRGAHFFILPL